MEDEKYADEEIDLHAEIDVFEEEEADWDYYIEKETDVDIADMKKVDIEFLEVVVTPLQNTREMERFMSMGKSTEVKKGTECISYARQNAQVNELYYSLSLPWLLNWFPRPTVKLKFVAQRDDELYEGFDDHSNGFSERGGFSIFDARGHSVKMRLGKDDDAEDDFLGLEEAESDEAETVENVDSDQLTDESESVVGVDVVTAELPDVSDDESDEGMDDDAMFCMDTYLARIFREKKNQAGGETAQSQLVLFKLCVLSLLEIYLHENPDEAYGSRRLMLHGSLPT